MCRIVIAHLLLILLTYLPPENLMAQQADMPKVIPPAPNAAALIKYVEVPVSTYTGIPNISIPLYTINVRDLTVPITMSYHAGGFRVEEEATWVGLGWSLNAGGSITRTVRGRPDPITNSWQSTYYPVPDTTVIEPVCQLTVDNQLVDYEPFLASASQYDMEPDLFVYNFGGKSGKFIFDGQNQIHLLKQEKMLIEPEWTITTEDGYKYYFGETLSSKEEVSIAEDIANGVNGEIFIQTWHLTRIVSPQGEEITFVYEKGSDTQLYQFSMTSRSEPVKDCFNCGATYSQVTPSAKVSYLKQILFKNGSVDLVINATDRVDLRGARSLQSLQVMQEGRSIPLKKFSFSYYYSIPDNFYGVHDRVSTRLMLDRINEEGSETDKVTGEVKSIILPPYRFEYNPEKLPVKTSTARDYWGFYNGQNYNTTHIPEYFSPSYIGVGQFYYPGAKREPDEKFMKAQVLEKIFYPTGGYTQFTYGANEYGNYSVDYEPSSPREALAETGFDHLNNTSGAAEVPFVINSQSGVPVQIEVNLYSSKHQEHCIDRHNTPSLENLYVKVDEIRYTYTVPSCTESPENQKVVYLQLAPGPHTLYAYCGEEDSHAQIRVIWKEKDINKFKQTAGGLRVEKITDGDWNSLQSQKVRIFNYGFTDSSGKEFSFGKIVAEPMFSYIDQGFDNNHIFGGDLGKCRVKYTSIVRTADSNISFFNNSGLVGYDKVVTVYGQQGEYGFTEEYFENETAPEIHTMYPSVPIFVPNTNGLQKKISHFSSTGKKVKEAENIYAVANGKQVKAMQVKGRYYPDDALGQDACNYSEDLSNCLFVRLFFYYNQSQWIQLTEVRERVYDRLNDQLFTETITKNQYDTGNKGHMQLSRRETKKSDGSTVINLYKYPDDYTALYFKPAASIVETVTKEFSATQTEVDAKTTAASYVEYHGLLPGKIHVLETEKPVAFEPAAPQIPAENKYVRKQTLIRDSKNNLIEILQTDQIPITYLWGYNNAYPVAEIKNATYAQARTALGIASTSEINLGAGGLTSAQINSLRTGLPDAMITTFTYDPLVGMTSQTDPNGVTMHYGYDGLGRLKAVKDRDQHPVSQYLYHYKQ